MLPRRQKLRKTVKRIGNRVRRAAVSTTIPVFVFGEMRSGTNMLADCFDASPLTDVFNETDEEAFVDYELRDLRALTHLINRSPASHAVFKAIADSNRAAEILGELPDSKAIWIYRRFEDVINSAVAKWQQHNEYLRLIVDEPDRARWRARNLSAEEISLIRRHYARNLSEPSARALIWYIRNECFFRQQLDEYEHLLLVNYETLVSDPINVMTRVFNFVKLPFRQKYMEHVTTRSVAKQSAPDLDPEVRILCEQLLSRLDDSARSH
jgi:Sulfotransferase domain